MVAFSGVMLASMLAEESGGCLALLLEWRLWALLLFICALISAAWSVLCFLLDVLSPAPRKIHFKVRVRRAVRKPKDGTQ